MSKKIAVTTFALGLGLLTLPAANVAFAKQSEFATPPPSCSDL